MLKKLLAGGAAVLMALGLAGCSDGGSSTSSNGAESGETNTAAVSDDGHERTYAVIMSLSHLEFFDALKAGVATAAEEVGAKWYFAGPQDFVPDQISQAIDQAVANGVDGIILHGQASETGAAVDAAVDAGVPVIIVNTDIPSKRLSFLGVDTYQAGYDMGTHMIELLNGKTGTVIVSSAFANAQPSALENLRGAKDALSEVPGITVLEVDDTADSNIAATNIGAAIQANPDVVGIIGQQAYSAVGAATAVREAGKTGDIVIIGRDRDSGTLELLETGEIAASYAQNSFVEGYIATTWLDAYSKGNLKVIDNYLEAGINPLPNSVDSGSIIITKDNADQFKKKYEYEVTASR